MRRRSPDRRGASSAASPWPLRGRPEVIEVVTSPRGTSEGSLHLGLFGETSPIVDVDFAERAGSASASPTWKAPSAFKTPTADCVRRPGRWRSSSGPCRGPNSTFGERSTTYAHVKASPSTSRGQTLASVWGLEREAAASARFRRKRRRQPGSVDALRRRAPARRAPGTGRATCPSRRPGTSTRVSWRPRRRRLRPARRPARGRPCGSRLRTTSDHADLYGPIARVRFPLSRPRL